MRNFVHFHTHSHYSVLDGLGRPTEMVKRAVEIGSPALAISDHGSISSMPELFRVCKEEKIKPIIGVEFYVVDDIEPNKDEKRFHLTVWAKNWNGVKSIMSKLTIANEQFYRRPRISFAQSLTFEDCCIGTACSFGILAHPNIVKLLPMFVRKYGDDFYLEMMPFNLKEQHFVNNMVLSLLKSYPFNVIATNDSHYIRKEDAKVHDALLAIQTNSSLNNPNRFKFDGDCFYMKSGDEMYEAFLKNNPYIPVEIVEKAISETVSLSEKCNIDLPEFPINLPSPYDEDDEVVFSNKIKIGWGNKQKYIEKFKTHSTEEYLNRVMFEIDVIKKKGFIRYFLVVEDMITWARNNGIMVGPARGSAAGSLVCWLMGITQVDPLRWDLYFERFLDVEREDYPDIDIDFQDDQRQRVFDYVRLKYGYDKTAQITTFGFLKPKSAFRDVCRVYDKDMATVNHLSKKIEDVSAFEEDPEVSAFRIKNPEIVSTTKSLCGTIRSQGCHAAGIVVSSRPLTDVCVVEKRSGSDVCNWDKRECENFGLIKIDALGLSTLSVLSRASDLIENRTGVRVDFNEIDLEDERVLKLFQDGKTTGVFQFEGKQMRQLLMSVNPKNFRGVTDCTALYRPGSLESGQTEKYVSIARGEEYEKYAFPELEPILKDTHGVMVFQEQIMQIFNKIGGFTWAEANKMRKIIGKKLGPGEFEKHRDHFVSGAVSNGIAEHHADKLFSDMVSFASYSFNRCVSGDTVLMRASNGGYSSDITVREMYKIKNDLDYAKSSGHKDLRSKWKYIGCYGYGLSLQSDGRIRKNKIIDIRPAGIRLVYMVDLGDGITIDVTDNHKFPTPSGNKMLSDLSIGDELYCCGAYDDTKTKKYNYSDGKQDVIGKKYGPRMGFPDGEDNQGYVNGGFTKFNNFKINTENVCFDCGKSGKMEVHHVDGDRYNNEVENLVKLCTSCHKKRHYTMGRTKRGEKGHPTIIRKIVNISVVGEIDTWDIEMDAPNHNFVTSTGIVTCNSHAISYTMISWWCAYLKVYYPVEYFAAVLDCSTKTNLIPAYIKECQRLEINVKLPDINISTTRYEIDKDGSIVAPLGIIKNVGGKAVDEILRARQDGPFISMKNFQERIVKRVCNIRVVDSLTKAGCFESLGIGTADLEQRGKDLCELVPIFQEIPVLTTHSDETLDKDEIKKLYADVFTCANASDKTMIAPYIGGAKPGIFIINSPQKNEDKNFSKDGTKFLIKTLTKADININAAYYTNPCKCFHKDGAKPSKECVNGCLEFLKREIKIVKPRLIICMSSDYIKMFTSAKPTMRDLHGKTIYCKEFDCYVLFSYSPQYLFYGDDKQPLIDRFIASLKELFTGDSDDSDFDDFD